MLKIVLILILATMSINAEYLTSQEVTDIMLFEQRGLFDFVIGIFGLEDVWAVIQNAGNNAVATLINELTTIFLKGSAAIELAKPVIAELIREIKDRGISSGQAVAQAISDLAAIIAGTPKTTVPSTEVPETTAPEDVADLIENRGIFDSILSTFSGLSEVWATIQGAGSSLVQTLVLTLTQIFFKGSAALDLAKPIVATLIQELKDHSIGTVDAVKQTISQLVNILKPNAILKRSQLIELHNRGVFDFVISTFGLTDVWTSIQEAGSGLVSSLVLTLTQIFLKGQAALDLARPIVATLIQELKDHSVGTVDAVTQTISQLASILTGNKRNAASERFIFDLILNTFGLADVWSIIQNSGSNAVSSLLTVLTQIFLKGQDALNQAKPIISNFIQELKDHSVSSVQAIAQTVSDLAAILAGNPNYKITDNKAIFDFVLEQFGLDNVWSSIQEAGSSAVNQLLVTLSQLLFKGQSALDAAKPIISSLIQEMTDHSVGSVQAVAQAISQLSAILAGNSKNLYNY